VYRRTSLGRTGKGNQRGNSQSSIKQKATDELRHSGNQKKQSEEGQAEGLNKSIPLSDYLSLAKQLIKQNEYEMQYRDQTT
jgi:hypothetical protein